MDYNGPTKRQLDTDEEPGNDKENSAISCENGPKKTSSNTRPVAPSSDTIFGIASSPPKFISLEEIMKAAKGVQNMALAHEIAVDGNFKLEEKTVPASPLEAKVKTTMHKAFFDVLRTKLEASPPDFAMAVGLLGEVKEELHACLMPHNTKTKQEIDAKLDPELLLQQAHAGSLEILPYLQYCVSIMAKICCPARQNAIDEMVALKDIPELFKQVLETLQTMKLDMANFTIRAIRPHLQAQSVDYERQKFSEFLKVCPTGLQNATKWLKKHCDFVKESGSLPDLTNPNEKKTLIAGIMTAAYLDLLAWDNDEPYPETCSLDVARFKSLGELLHVATILGAATLVAMSNAGPIPQGLPGFREKIKAKLKVLLQDDSKDEPKNLEEVLKGAAEVIAKDIDEAVVKHSAPGQETDLRMSPEAKTSLMSQVVSVADPQHNIRKLVEQRIKGFLALIINSASASPTKFPPGLTGIHEELKDLAAMFLQLTLHNKRVFMTYYVDIIDKEFGVVQD